MGSELLTEKQKCAAGMIYSGDYDPELKAERLHAKSLLFEFNHLHPAKVDEKKAIIKKLLGKFKRHK